MSQRAKLQRSRRPTAADEIRAVIEERARQATSADRDNVRDLVARAEMGQCVAEVYTISPGMAALLFLNHNPHNRAWRATGRGSCQEYARRMLAGQWRRNNATVGFFCDGNIGDGQHRLSGSAYSGLSFVTAVVFGIERDAITTVDDGGARSGADGAQMDGISDAKTKEVIVKVRAAYLSKRGDVNAPLRSPADIKNAIVSNDNLLMHAMTLGRASLQNLVDPVFKAPRANALAYILLTGGWPSDLVQSHLSSLQAGLSRDGERPPHFVAAEVIKAGRKTSGVRDRLSPIKEIGCAVFAINMAQRGAATVRQADVRNSVRRTFADPTFPRETGAAVV